MSDSESISSHSSYSSSDSEIEDDKVSYSSDGTSGDEELDSIKNDSDNALLVETIKTYLKTEHPDEYVHYKDKIKNIVNPNANSKKSKKYEKKQRKGVKEVDINDKHKKHSHNNRSNKLEDPPNRRGRGRPRKGEESVPLSRMTKKELQEYSNSLMEKLSKYEKKYMKEKIAKVSKKSNDNNNNEDKPKNPIIEEKEIIPNDIEGREIQGSPIDPYYI